LTVALELNDIGRGKFDFDVAGHYSRPDVFQLIVNEAPMNPVVAKAAE
jgi:nitrilase